jgi:hypothetical protein
MPLYSIDEMTGHAGKETSDEDSKLKDAVHTHGGKNWAVIAALWFQVARKGSAMIDGTMAWMPATTKHPKVQVAEQ